MTRLLLTLAALVVFVLVMWGMRAGWRHRAQRQHAIAPPPPVPADPGPAVLSPLTGLYVGTTYADQWQNRVVVHGLGRRATCTATLTTAGLLVDRAGDTAVFVPAAAIRDAGLGRGLAGKVTGDGGLLVVRWTSPDGTELDTALRADDAGVHPDWIEAIDSMTAPRATR